MKLRLSCGTVALWLLSSATLWAANITWSLGPTYSGPTGFNALSTTGFLVDAGHADWVGNGGNAQVVDPSGVNIKFNPRNIGIANQGVFNSGSPGTTDAAFNTIMDRTDFNSANIPLGVPAFVTGLTPGRTYQVQLFGDDARGCCSTRTQFFTDGAGNNSPTYTQGTFTSILGTFTANATTQNIGMSASSNNPIFDAFVVRDITAPAAIGSATFTLKPDSVNRIIGGANGNTHYEDHFSTHSASVQHSLVQLTFESLNSALESALGPASGYKINSATLTVGSATDDYAQASTAHEVLVSYNPLTVTFNSFNNGGVAGVDFEALAEATGVVSGATTTFDLTAYVRAIADGGPDLGLYFPTSGVGNNANFTENTNLVFTISAQVVPEPSSAALWTVAAVATVGAAGFLRRRRGSGQRSPSV